MSDCEKSLRTETVLKNYETDFRREIKPSAILALFQEIAAAHAGLIGMGDGELRAQDMHWVLSKIFVKIERRPVCGEKLAVVTWPHAPNKAIFERSFCVEGEGGERLISAFSRWCILNGKGRIVPASRVPCKLESFFEEHAADADGGEWEGCARIAPAFSVKVAYSEIDLNRHVNNVKYADHLFDCFSLRELEGYSLRDFQIHYVRQSVERDVLDFYRQEVTPGEFSVEGVRNGETAVAARIRFA